MHKYICNNQKLKNFYEEHRKGRESDGRSTILGD